MLGLNGYLPQALAAADVKLNGQPVSSQHTAIDDNTAN
jgi:hypothetical protein